MYISIAASMPKSTAKTGAIGLIAERNRPWYTIAIHNQSNATNALATFTIR